MSDDTHRLPVIQNDIGEEAAPSCSPSIYISNEETALLMAMRELRRQSAGLKKNIGAATGADRSRLETELESLRAEWRNLAAQREKAYVRKMIMLGHLPPEADPGL
jgi:hypothetical protein